MQRGRRLCRVLRFVCPPARKERPLRTTVPAVLALLVPPSAVALDDLAALAVQLPTGHAIPLVEVEVRRPPQGPWELVAEIAESGAATHDDGRPTEPG